MLNAFMTKLPNCEDEIRYNGKVKGEFKRCEEFPVDDADNASLARVLRLLVLRDKRTDVRLERHLARDLG